MFKWLSRKLDRVRYDQNSTNEVCNEPRSLRQEQLRIGITNANGGHIISFETTDAQTHNSNYTTYVIHDGLNFNEELSKMITMETLKL